MTRRRASIARRIAAGESLDIFTEVAAAGMLWSWVKDVAWEVGRFWLAVKHAYGERIDSKLLEACPGCRPGYRYALGEFPPVPLVKPLPPEHINQREHLIVDGVKHWHVGQPWQQCQAEHLRAIGELDGSEWKRYVRWREEGYPPRYVLEQSPDGRPMVALAHCCW